MNAVDLCKRVKFSRAGCAKQPVPCIRTYAGNATELTVGYAEADSTLEGGQISQKIPDRPGSSFIMVQGQNQEDGSLGYFRINGLRCSQRTETPFG